MPHQTSSVLGTFHVKIYAREKKSVAQTVSDDVNWQYLVSWSFDLDRKPKSVGWDFICLQLVQTDVVWCIFWSKVTALQSWLGIVIICGQTSRKKETEAPCRASEMPSCLLLPAGTCESCCEAVGGFITTRSHTVFDCWPHITFCCSSQEVRMCVTCAAGSAGHVFGSAWFCKGRMSHFACVL